VCEGQEQLCILLLCKLAAASSAFTTTQCSKGSRSSEPHLGGCTRHRHCDILSASHEQSISHRRWEGWGGREHLVTGNSVVRMGSGWT
jgi:hypothetical protein